MDAFPGTSASRLTQPAASPAAPPDSLADSILYLAAHHGHALSREALLAGLPITDGRLSIALYERAAARAGLEVEVFKRKIADIPSLVLPAVLIMRDGTTRILHEVNSDARLAKVIDPSNASNAKPVTLDSQATDYVGFAFLVRPAVVSRRS